MDQKNRPSITLETRDGVTVVSIHRSMSQSQHLIEMERHLHDAVSELDHPRVVINFGDVSFFPSTGVGLIISTRNQITEKHGVLAIAAMSDLIAHLFKLTGLTKVLPVYDTVDEAVAALAPEPS